MTEEKKILSEKEYYSEKAKIGAKARWANISKEERSKKMSEIRKKGYQNYLEKIKKIKEC